MIFFLVKRNVFWICYPKTSRIYDKTVRDLCVCVCLINILIAESSYKSLEYVPAFSKASKSAQGRKLD